MLRYTKWENLTGTKGAQQPISRNAAINPISSLWVTHPNFRINVAMQDYDSSNKSLKINPKLEFGVQIYGCAFKQVGHRTFDVNLL